MKNKFNEKNRRAQHAHCASRGITLVALVITIIVLLILAGVTINMALDSNGLFDKASEAKIMTALGTIKEEIELERTIYLMSLEELLADGKIKRSVQVEDKNYYMHYVIKPNAYKGMQGLGKGSAETLRDVFLIDDEFHIKYIDKSGKEYGEDIGEKILEDETEIRFASKTFSEYISRISGISEAEMKFKWMKNQTTLRIADHNIVTLEDLVFFPNLIQLSIAGGVNLENLDGIENCKKLTSFSIETGCSVNDFSALKYLTNLTSVASTSRINLDNLIESIKEHNITTLSVYVQKDTKSLKKVEQLPNLTSLTISGGEQLTKIEGVKDLKKLKFLAMNDCGLTEIAELESLNLLESVSFDNNDIKDITILASNEKLKRISLLKNPNINADRSSYSPSELAKIDKIGEILNNGGEIYLDADKLKLFNNYRKLNLSNQNLQDLSVIEGMTDLEELNISNNNITLSDENSQRILKSLTKLKKLNLNANLKLTDISSLNELNNLSELSILYCPVNLKQIEEKISSIYISTNATNIMTIEECNKEKITSITMNLSDVEQIPNFAEFPNLEKLELDFLRPKASIDVSQISQCEKLVTLRLASIDLHEKMMDFSKLTKLTNLNLINDTLWTEDLENLKALKNNTNLTIYLSGNSIIDASALLVLDPSCKIDLRNNISLTQESKEKLKARFGGNVSF